MSDRKNVEIGVETSSPVKAVTGDIPSLAAEELLTTI